MSGDNKKRKPGRPSGSKNKTALVRLDKAVHSKKFVRPRPAGAFWQRRSP